uniref:RING-H2 finger protein ATL79 n=1 Tax=Anthurium amnicola TaxID=1678845 RepID=A0A1D1ZLZ0_9ARAE
MSFLTCRLPPVHATMWSLQADAVLLLLLLFTVAVISLLLLLQVYMICFLRGATRQPTGGGAGDAPAVGDDVDASAAASLLPELLCGWPGGDEEAAADCVVCLSALREEEDGGVRVLPRCRHAFHAGCIGRWLVSHSVCCPICRTPVRSPAPGPAAPGAAAVIAPPPPVRGDEEAGVAVRRGHGAPYGLVLLDEHQLRSELHLPLLLY